MLNARVGGDGERERRVSFWKTRSRLTTLNSGKRKLKVEEQSKTKRTNWHKGSDRETG